MTFNMRNEQWHAREKTQAAAVTLKTLDHSESEDTIVDKTFHFNLQL